MPCSAQREVVWVVPVELGMIEEELETLLPALVSQHFEDVLLVWSAIHDVIVRHLGIEHRKAVMMLAGNSDVFHSGCLGQSNPFSRTELRWIELRRDFLIFGNWNLLFVHDPFALTQDTVHSPMDEHAKLCVLKPFASRLVGWTWRIGSATRRLSTLRFARSLRRNHRSRPHKARNAHENKQATPMQQPTAETHTDPLTGHESDPFDQVRKALQRPIKYP